MGSLRHGTQRVLASLARTDPGFARLISAVRAVVSVLGVIGAEILLLDATGALQVRVGPTVTAAQAGQQHHQILIIAILLNGVIAMVSGLAINDPTLLQQVVNIGLLPLFVVPALTLGLALGGHRAWALASFPLVLAIGGYCRRFGTRAGTAGTLLFMGEFIGFLLHGSLALTDIGWLAAEVGTATVVLAALRAVAFRPDRQRTLRWLRRSFQARTARVAELALAYIGDPGPSSGRHLTAGLEQLNEAALLIDAQLPSGAARLHQCLFDTELALTNMARFARHMADGDLPGRARETIRSALVAVRDGHPTGLGTIADEIVAVLKRSHTRGFDRIVPLRFATSLRVYAEARAEWESLDATTDDGGTFVSVVTTNSGWLPGSAQVSAEASQHSPDQSGPVAGGSRHWPDWRHPPLYVRTAVQTAAAVGVAVVVGDAISPRRFYWAVLAAALAFVGTSYVAEQARKAILRVTGTVVGIAVGSAAVRLIGHHSTVSWTVTLIAIFFGVYLFRVSYAFMVIGITVAISQVYVQLDEYSVHLLLIRLAETAAGSAVALAVVAFVFPLRRSRVLQIALAAQLRAVSQLVGDAAGHLADPGASGKLRNDGRQLDVTHHAVVTTLSTLRWAVLGDVNRRLGAVLATSNALRSYGRTLVADADAATPLEGQAADDLFLAVTALRHSLDALVAAASGQSGQTYVRCGALIETVKTDLVVSVDDPRMLALRDLGLLDAALATLAPLVGCSVVGLDTGEEPAPDSAQQTAAS